MYRLTFLSSSVISPDRSSRLVTSLSTKGGRGRLGSEGGSRSAQRPSNGQLAETAVEPVEPWIFEKDDNPALVVSTLEALARRCFTGRRHRSTEQEYRSRPHGPRTEETAEL